MHELLPECLQLQAVVYLISEVVVFSVVVVDLRCALRELNVSHSVVCGFMFSSSSCASRS